MVGRVSGLPSLFFKILAPESPAHQTIILTKKNTRKQPLSFQKKFKHNKKTKKLQQKTRPSKNNKTKNTTILLKNPQQTQQKTAP
jgi:hypothetical protein